MMAFYMKNKQTLHAVLQLTRDIIRSRPRSTLSEKVDSGPS